MHEIVLFGREFAHGQVIGFLVVRDGTTWTNKGKLTMPTCFVIQPFDGGKFDKRFNDVFKPALEQAGFEPYRVDRDPAVEVPIESIEEGIRNSTICLADITLDNPNVWYELGYAFASGRSVVLVCADERGGSRFPFDIQHRSIIRYRSESPSDFDDLKDNIAERSEAFRQRAETRQFIEHEQVAPQEGVSAIEIQVLALAAAETAAFEEFIAIYKLKYSAEKSGLAGIGFGLALRRLQQREFIRSIQERDHEGEVYPAIALSDKGWSWIDRHESLFVLHKGKSPPTHVDEDPFDDDIPF